MTALALFKEFIESLDLDIHVMYENENYDAPLGITWARFTLGSISTSRESQGDCGTNLIEGEAMLELMHPSLNGTEDILNKAAQIIDAADVYVSALRFVEPAFYDEGFRADTTWYVLPVILPYQLTKRRGPTNG